MTNEQRRNEDAAARQISRTAEAYGRVVQNVTALESVYATAPAPTSKPTPRV